MNKENIKKLRRLEIRNEISLIKFMLDFCVKHGASDELKDILYDTRKKIKDMFKVRNDFSFLEVHND